MSLQWHLGLIASPPQRVRVALILPLKDNGDRNLHIVHMAINGSGFCYTIPQPHLKGPAFWFLHLLIPEQSLMASPSTDQIWPIEPDFHIKVLM